jgi:hypothetical protein
MASSMIDWVDAQVPLRVEQHREAHSAKPDRVVVF